MEAQSAFVGANGAVHLHAVAAVDLDFPMAVGPGNTEYDDSLRLGHAFENLGLLVLQVLLDERPHRFGHLGHRLMKFGFNGITLLECGQETG